MTVLECVSFAFTETFISVCDNVLSLGFINTLWVSMDSLATFSKNTEQHHITIGIPSWGFLRLFHENINGIYRKCGTSKLGSHLNGFVFHVGP